MPNGKVGDHWYTDVVVHNLATFSPEVDDLVREVDALARDPRNATDPPSESFEHPYRQRAEEIVDQHLERIGYRTLSDRSGVVGREYRHLTPDEFGALEHDLRALFDRLPKPTS